jgi:hypothetical protein
MPIIVLGDEHNTEGLFKQVPKRGAQDYLLKSAMLRSAPTSYGKVSYLKWGRGEVNAIKGTAPLYRVAHSLERNLTIPRMTKCE